MSGIHNEGTENRTENSTINLYINLWFVYMWSAGAVLVTSSVPPKQDMEGYKRFKTIRMTEGLECMRDIWREYERPTIS